VQFMTYLRRALSLLALAALSAACASGPRVTTIQPVSETADTPYRKVLVIALFESFDSRRYLETETVKRLSELGVEAVASTSMMNSRTPLVRSTFVEMVGKIDADAVLVTQLANLELKEAKVVNMRPEATYNIRPTYYYNVFSVELTEYTEPRSVELKHSLSLVTEVLSVKSQEPVWSIQSDTTIVQDHDQARDYSIFVREANAIATHMSRDGLIAR
jgi:hypothetical protein